MAENYATKIYKTTGGDELVVAPGGKITNNGVQAAAIASPTSDSAGTKAAIDAIIAALKGVGITA
jgi:hypothetical protein